MEIKVKKTTATAGETSSTISLTEGLKIPSAVKSQIKQDVGDYIVESILSSVGKAQSPVAGGDWTKKLSSEYKKKKLADGLPPIANMEFEGDMLDALTFEETTDGIKVGWFGEEAPKADGHNNFSGKSELPRRQSLPEEGQEFDRSIQKGIEAIVADALVGSVEFDAADFADVGTRSELYDALLEYFPGLTRREIKMAVARSPELARLLDDENLLELL